MQENLLEKYQQRANTFNAQSEKLERRYNQFSLVRLLLFIVGVGVSIYLWAEYWPVGLGFSLVFLFGFIAFVRWHQRIKSASQLQKTLSEMNAREGRILHLDFADGYLGEEFGDMMHPYALDLDLFGPFSLFQYLNRGMTSLGRQCLADWLTQPADLDLVKERQAAVTELNPKLDWRQHLQALGTDCEENASDLQQLKKWLAEPLFVLPNQWLIGALYFAPFWGIAALLLTIFYIPWQFGILLFLPPVLILRNYLNQVNKTHLLTSRAGDVLAHYSRIVGHIEKEDFSTPYLRKVHEDFVMENGKSASGEIRKLAYIISQLNVRYNVFAIILNLLGLWDLQWVYRLERWKENNQNRLPAWFEGLAQVEAVLSLSTLHYNNPDWIFPALTEASGFRAIELGHPLILSTKRISNDLALPTRGHIKLITGSNMAGKSTFLRTVGLNIVLAMMGAPVCAREMQLPFLRVYTSMRTQDALHESTSSFYAELKRLKFIIEAVEAGEPVFFLLDEILKGTNSRDRHTGSKALIRQLIRFKGAGLIATHDLELGGLEAESDGAIENLCLEVAIKNGELFFDYKVKKGVSQSFNATLLMQKMGIRIEEDLND